jgi:hypothetical protein
MTDNIDYQTWRQEAYEVSIDQQRRGTREALWAMRVLVLLKEIELLDKKIDVLHATPLADAPEISHHCAECTYKDIRRGLERDGLLAEEDISGDAVSLVEWIALRLREHAAFNRGLAWHVED